MTFANGSEIALPVAGPGVGLSEFKILELMEKIMQKSFATVSIATLALFSAACGESNTSQSGLNHEASKKLAKIIHENDFDLNCQEIDPSATPFLQFKASVRDHKASLSLTELPFFGAEPVVFEKTHEDLTAGLLVDGIDEESEEGIYMQWGADGDSGTLSVNWLDESDINSLEGIVVIDGNINKSPTDIFTEHVDKEISVTCRVAFQNLIESEDESILLQYVEDLDRLADDADAGEFKGVRYFYVDSDHGKPAVDTMLAELIEKTKGDQARFHLPSIADACKNTRSKTAVNCLKNDAKKNRASLSDIADFFTELDNPEFKSLAEDFLKFLKRDLGENYKEWTIDTKGLINRDSFATVLMSSNKRKVLVLYWGSGA